MNCLWGSFPRATGLSPPTPQPWLPVFALITLPELPSPQGVWKWGYLPPHTQAQCLQQSRVFIYLNFWPQRVLAAALGSFGVDLGLCSCGMWDL